MSYTLTWSAADKADIQKELADLRKGGHNAEIGRVLAYLASVASDGAKGVSQNIHMTVGPRNLYSACPFGTVGVFLPMKVLRPHRYAFWASVPTAISTSELRRHG